MTYYIYVFIEQQQQKQLLQMHTIKTKYTKHHKKFVSNITDSKLNFIVVFYCSYVVLLFIRQPGKQAC